MKNIDLSIQWRSGTYWINWSDLLKKAHVSKGLQKKQNSAKIGLSLRCGGSQLWFALIFYT